MSLSHENVPIVSHCGRVSTTVWETRCTSRSGEEQGRGEEMAQCERLPRKVFEEGCGHVEGGEECQDTPLKGGHHWRKKLILAQFTTKLNNFFIKFWEYLDTKSTNIYTQNLSS